MFSYQISEEELKVQIFYNNVIVDETGPWESLEAAESWAVLYTNKMNSTVE